MSSIENTRRKLILIDHVNNLLDQFNADPSLEEWEPYIGVCEDVRVLKEFYEKELERKENMLDPGVPDMFSGDVQ